MQTFKDVKLMSHPLEQAMGLPDGSTQKEITRVEVENIKTDIFDEKDESNESQMDDIITKALEVYEIYKEEAEIAEDRLKARLGEVGLQYLNLAREAIKDKMQLKANKEKLLQKVNAKPASKTVNNILVTDRNSILKDIDNGKVIE